MNSEANGSKTIPQEWRGAGRLGRRSIGNRASSRGRAGPWKKWTNYTSTASALIS